MRRKPRSAITGMSFVPPKKMKGPTVHHDCRLHRQMIDEVTYKRHQESMSRDVRKGLKNKDACSRAYEGDISQPP